MRSVLTFLALAGLYSAVAGSSLAAAPVKAGVATLSPANTKIQFVCAHSGAKQHQAPAGAPNAEPHRRRGQGEQGRSTQQTDQAIGSLDSGHFLGLGRHDLNSVQRRQTFGGQHRLDFPAAGALVEFRLRSLHKILKSILKPDFVRIALRTAP